ncbi:T9SS type A sorting domain-containing protein [Aquimarina mytili]|uniref:T9SS type A sorting domain-containing protein n=1 Tax=Aquimarina mytili TaxID=874423 RepID=A0A936ZWP9_9FLAO|nr:T9SS type A sorting domain-containing protein [Aquimarina mytili]MBL0685687.1 T9SS type A sorting domain-containing protein [Aquimarina mytili]
MNIHILLILVVLTGAQLQAQSIERQIIGSTGASFDNGTIALDFTVGETAITTLKGDTFNLTQGFHQSTYTILTIDPDTPTIFSMYPNPTSGLVFIDGEGILETEIYSITGQKVYKTNTTRFDLTHLSSGVYIARILTTTRSITKRIVKE